MASLGYGHTGFLLWLEDVELNIRQGYFESRLNYECDDITAIGRNQFVGVIRYSRSNLIAITPGMWIVSLCCPVSSELESL